MCTHTCITCTYFITMLFVLGYQNLNSPLHLATKHDHLGVVDLLGRSGADVSIVNKVQ